MQCVAQSKPDGDCAWVVGIQKASSCDLLSGCSCLVALCMFLLFLSGGMPAPNDEKKGENKAPATPSESESSSYETVEVEEELPAWALAAATPKSAATPVAPLRPTPKGVSGPKACAASAVECSDTEPESCRSETPVREPETERPPEESSDSRAGLSRRKRTDTGPARPRGRSPQRGAPPARASKHDPPAEPEEPPKGKGKTKGRTTCRFCWRRIGPSESSRDQHTYWSVNCLSWQQWSSGRFSSWQAACEAAEAQKLRRERRARLRNEAAAALASPPRPTRRRREEKPAKEKAEKVRKPKTKEGKQARAAVRNKGRERKERKEKGKKRPYEEPWPSPSPDPARHKRDPRDRRPPSSDDEGGEGLRPRLKQTGPGTFKIVMGR